MATDDLGGPGGEQINNRMANWPKWATEDSIRSLGAAIARRDKRIMDLTSQVVNLIKSQNNKKEPTEPRSQAQLSQQQARVSGTKSDAKPRAQDLFNKRMADAISTGIGALDRRLARTNNLLANINKQFSHTEKQNVRTKSRAGLGPAAGRIRQEETIRSREERRSRSRDTRYNDDFSYLRGRFKRFNVGDDDSKHKYADETTQRARRVIRDAPINMRGMTPEQQQAAAKEFSESLSKEFGRVLNPALRDFSNAINAANGDIKKIDEAFQKLGAEIETERVQLAKRPKETNSDYWDRIMSQQRESMGTLGKEGLSLGGVFKSVGGGLLNMLGPGSKLATGLAFLGARIGLVAGVAKSLFDLWKGGAVETTQALMRGLEGLTQGGVLSFAIAAKSAGLTVEQFSKALDQAGGMANLLDEDVKNTGQLFAAGINKMLNSAEKFNNFGMNIENLNRVYARQVRVVARSGQQGQAAIDQAHDRTISEADEMYRLSVMTGRTTEDLNNAFDELYNNDMFRIATTRALARGEMDLAKKTETLGKTMAAIGGDMAKQLEDELALAATGGFDPTMLEGFRDLTMLAPQMAKALQETQNMNQADARAHMARAAQDFRRSGDMQMLAALAGPGQDPKARAIMGFIQRAAESRTDAPEAGQGPQTAGARGARAASALDRSAEMLKGEFLRLIQASGVMTGMTNLAEAASDVTRSFLSLNETLRNIIGLAGFAAAALLALGGPGLLKGAGRGLGGLFRRGGGGATPNTPRGGGTPPVPPGGGTGAAASEMARDAQAAARGATNAAEGAAAGARGAAAAEGAAAARGATTAAEGAAAARGAKPTPQEGKITPTETPKPVEPAARAPEPAKPVEPAARAPEPAKPVEPPKPAEPAKPVEPPKPAEPAKPAETPRPANENRPAGPTSANDNVTRGTPVEPAKPSALPGEPPPAAGTGTASRFSEIAAGAKAVGREVRGGGILGAVIGIGINELTDVQDLKKARTEVLEKYRKGEISRKDAEDALKEIDDKLAESRGGSLTRGAVSGATGTLGSIGMGALGSVVPGAGTTAGVIMGGIAGAEIGDRLFGNAAEKAGGWISKQLFGGSTAAAARELDAADDAQLPTVLRGKGFKRGRQLTDRQMELIDRQLATGISIESLGMPDWLKEQYLKQKETRDRARSTGTPTGAQSSIPAAGRDATLLPGQAAAMAAGQTAGQTTRRITSVNPNTLRNASDEFLAQLAATGDQAAREELRRRRAVGESLPETQTGQMSENQRMFSGVSDDDLKHIANSRAPTADKAKQEVTRRDIRRSMADMTPAQLAALAVSGDQNARDEMRDRSAQGSARPPGAATPPGQATQPGTMTSSRTSFRIAGMDVTPGQDLSPDQMTAIGMALSMNPNNASNYPDWVMSQYNKQKGSTPAAGTGNIRRFAPDENGIMRPVSDSGIGNTPAQPRTPTGVTGALAGAAAIAADVDGTRAQDAASQAEQRTVSARRALTESQQLVELQQQNNMLLSRIVEQNGMITGDTRKQVDLLENINNKT